MRKEGTHRRLPALLLALSMLLSCAPAALAAETAAAMQLAKTEGVVAISNNRGRSVSLIEKMRLYSGYHVEKEEASYAWIDLDSTKLNKLDALSEVEIRKSGKQLELLLNEGNIFFNVTEPLEDGESLNIRTSTIVVGIRGTCGWVKIIDQWTVEVCILEGTVTISVTDPVTGQTKEDTLSAGERARCVVYPQDRDGDKCDILRDRFQREDIDGFVLVELKPDAPLVEKIYAESGIDLRDWPRDPDEWLKEDQEEVRRKLEDIEEALEEQDEHISKDPVWPEEPPAVQPQPEEEPPEDAPAADPSSVVTLTLPVEDDVVDDYLGRGYVRQVIVRQAGVRASTGSTLEVDSGITVPAGKTLTMDGGRAMINVLAGQKLEVNGTLEHVAGQQPSGEGANYYTSSGTVINRGTIRSSIIVDGGRLENHGTMDGVQINRVATVDNTNGVIKGLTLSRDADGSTIRGGTIRPGGGTAPLNIVVGGWTQTSIVDCVIENENGAAVFVLVYTGFIDFLESYKDSIHLPRMSNSVIRAKIEDVMCLRVLDGSSDPAFIPNGYSVQQSGEWYHLVETGTAPTPPIDPNVRVTVTFEGNGGVWPDGSGSIGNNLPSGTPLQTALTDVGYPTRTGYTLAGWNTAADGSGTAFAAAAPITADVTLYAQWAAGGVTWRYDEPTATLYIEGSGPMEDYPLSSVSIADAITTAPWAEYAAEMRSLVIEDGITSIGESAFCGCTGLTNMAIPDSVTSIGSFVFAKCSGLTGALTIPENVTRIGDGAFYECSGLSGTLTIPAGITSIGSSVFYNCSGLTGALTIPAGVTSAGNYAFAGCSGLTGALMIPDSVTTIGDHAFNGCSGLSGALTIPDSVTNIGIHAFQHCSSLTSIAISNRVTGIGDGTFYGCSSLTSIEIPNSVTTIGGSVFLYCSSLTTVTIPDSVTSIGGSTFHNTALRTVYYGGTQAQWNALMPNTDLVDMYDATIYCSDGSITYAPTPRTTTASPYSDVPLDAWYAAAVLYCRDHGLMSGVDATRFSPGAGMTRAMLVTVLHRLAGSPEAPAASFRDVPAASWYAPAISWAVQKGVAGGYGDGRFGPDDPVTRQQAAALLWRFAGEPDALRQSAFSDREAVDSYAQEAVDWAHAAGILNGMGDGRFTPGGSATRAQTAAILMNYLRSQAGEGDALSTASAMDVMCAPSGMVPMEDGSFLVTDTYHKLLWKVRLGAGTVLAGGETTQGLYGEPLGGYNDASLLESFFKEPWAAVPFLDGWAVSDTANNAVRLVRRKDTQTLNGKTGEGLTVTAMGVAFDRPTGLAADKDGNLYVSDTGGGAVRKISPQGRVTTAASRLSEPMGLCWKNGALYIAEAGAHRVVKLKDGKLSTVAGSGEEGLADGPAEQAAFSAPQGVAVGDNGAVYVSDTGNSAVRMVRDGEVTTLAVRDVSLARAGLTAPRGLLVQGDRLYICDGFARKVFVLRLG